MDSKEFKEWLEGYKHAYPVDYATFDDEILYEIFLMNEDNDTEKE
jgi:hypothetical protein